MPINTIEWIKEAIVTGLLGSFWWTATFLYGISQWKKFSIWIYFINVFIAFFIWYTIGQFIWPNISFRDWLIAIAWSTSIPLMAIIEKKWATIIYKFINK